MARDVAQLVAQPLSIHLGLHQLSMTHMYVIPATKRWKQNDQKFKVISFIKNLSPSRACLKKETLKYIKFNYFSFVIWF